MHQGCVEKSETIERKVSEEKNGTWARGLFKIKINILKAGHFCSMPSFQEEPTFNAWPRIHISPFFLIL